MLAENPELWEWLEQRWAKLTAVFDDGYGGPGAELAAQYQRLARRRLEALAVARTMDVRAVDASAVEAFEPEELRHA